jgi:thioester reductase-like protein
MKPIHQFLADLSYRDVRIWIDGDRLRCNAPQGVLTPTLKAQISERKAEILKVLSSKTNGQTTAVALDKEVVLDPTICSAPVSSEAVSSAQTTREPSRILLTGATGFLGTFLLHELLHQTSAEIYCLVRAENSDIGKRKIQQQLENYLRWDEQFSHRIISVIGDLSKPLLGLTEEQFLVMSRQIDAIYHNGASINLLYPYSALKAVNVLGTQEVLRLAVQTTIKPVHFVSTLSVIDPSGSFNDNIIRENDPLNHWMGLYNGYAQSKWVAERIMAIAQSRGIPVFIYRPGTITGDSQTGISNPNDFMSTLLKAFIQLGCAPDFDAYWVLTPVDYVSQAIIHLSKQKELIGRVFHMLHPHPLPMSTVIDWIGLFGYPIRQVPYDQWRNNLIEFVKQDRDTGIKSLVSIFPEQFSDDQLRALQLQYDCQNTLNGLSNSSICCPPINAELIKTYLLYFIRQGVIASPNRERSEFDQRLS